MSRLRKDEIIGFGGAGPERHDKARPASRGERLPDRYGGGVVKGKATVLERS